ncbi:MAG TPA: tape measure protein [Bacteroidales bacterium]|nr:tape measure protein [Bacteroidales bacterium]
MNNTDGALDFEVLLKTSDFKREIADLENRLRGLSGTAEREGSHMDSTFRRVGAAIGSYFTFQAAQRFIGDIARVRGEFQQLEVAFTTMLRSKEKADQLMSQAIELAAKTPFELKDVATGAKQLLAYGTESTKVVDTVRMLGNVAAGVSAPLNDIVYLYGTLRTQGQAYTRDIVQFAGRGIPIYEELGKVLGITSGEVKSYVESGRVGFKEVEKAFENMTSKGGMFFNLMEEQSKTITGKISNLRDSWAMMLNELGQGSEGAINRAIEGAAWVVENYQTIGKVLMGLVATYGSYKAAVITVTAVEKLRNTAMIYDIATKKAVVTWEGLHAVAINKVKAAQAALNKTMLANPYVAVAAALAAVVSALLIFRDRTIEITEVGKGFNEELAKEQANIDAVFMQLRNTDKGTQAYNSAVEQANKILGQYNVTLLTQESNLDAIKRAYDEVTKAMVKNIALQSKEAELKDKSAELYKSYNSSYADFVSAIEKAGKKKVQVSVVEQVNEAVKKNAEELLKTTIKQTQVGDALIVDERKTDKARAIISQLSKETGLKFGALEGYVTAYAKYVTDQAKLVANINDYYDPFINTTQQATDEVTRLKQALSTAETKAEKESIAEQLKSLTQVGAVKPETIASIGKLSNELGELKKKQSEIPTTAEEYKEFQKQIDAVQAKIEGITGKSKQDKVEPFGTLEYWKSVKDTLEKELLTLISQKQGTQLLTVIDQGTSDIINEYMARMDTLQKKVATDGTAVVTLAVEDAGTRERVNEYLQQIEAARKAVERDEGILVSLSADAGTTQQDIEAYRQSIAAAQQDIDNFRGLVVETVVNDQQSREQLQAFLSDVKALGLDISDEQVVNLALSVNDAGARETLSEYFDLINTYTQERQQITTNIEVVADQALRDAGIFEGSIDQLREKSEEPVQQRIETQLSVDDGDAGEAIDKFTGEVERLRRESSGPIRQDVETKLTIDDQNTKAALDEFTGETDKLREESGKPIIQGIETRLTVDDQASEKQQRFQKDTDALRDQTQQPIEQRITTVLAVADQQTTETLTRYNERLQNLKDRAGEAIEQVLGVRVDDKGIDEYVTRIDQAQQEIERTGINLLTLDVKDEDARRVLQQHIALIKAYQSEVQKNIDLILSVQTGDSEKKIREFQDQIAILRAKIDSEQGIIVALQVESGDYKNQISTFLDAITEARAQAGQTLEAMLSVEVDDSQAVERLQDFIQMVNLAQQAVNASDVKELVLNVSDNEANTKLQDYIDQIHAAQQQIATGGTLLASLDVEQGDYREKVRQYIDDIRHAQQQIAGVESLVFDVQDDQAREAVLSYTSFVQSQASGMDAFAEMLLSVDDTDARQTLADYYDIVQKSSQQIKDNELLISTLEVNDGNFTQKMAEYRDNISRAQEQINSVSDAVVTLTVDDKDAAQKMQQFIALINSAQSRISESKISVLSLQVEDKGVKEKLQQHADLVERYQKQIDQNNDLIVTLSVDDAQYKERLLEYQGNIARAQQQIDQSRSAVLKITGDTSGYDAKIQQVKDSIEQVQRKINEIEWNAKSFDEVIAYRKSQYELYSQWVEALGQKTAERQFALLLASGRDYEEYLTNQRERLLRELEDLARQENEILSSGAVTETQSKQLESIETRKTQIQEKIVRVKVEIDQQQAPEAVLERFRTEINKTTTQAQNLTQALKSLEKQREELSSDLTPVGMMKYEEITRQIAEVSTRLSEQYGAIINESQSFQNNYLSIQRDAEAERRRLISEAAKGAIQPDALTQMLSEVNQQEARQISELNTKVSERQQVYQQLLGDLGTFTAAQLSKLLADTETVINRPEYADVREQVLDLIEQADRKIAQTGIEGFETWKADLVSIYETIRGLGPEAQQQADIIANAIDAVGGIAPMEFTITPDTVAAQDGVKQLSDGLQGVVELAQQNMKFDPAPQYAQSIQQLLNTYQGFTQRRLAMERAYVEDINRMQAELNKAATEQDKNRLQDAIAFRRDVMRQELIDLEDGLMAQLAERKSYADIYLQYGRDQLVERGRQLRQELADLQALGDGATDEQRRRVEELKAMLKGLDASMLVKNMEMVSMWMGLAADFAGEFSQELSEAFRLTGGIADGFMELQKNAKDIDVSSIASLAMQVNRTLSGMVVNALKGQSDIIKGIGAFASGGVPGLLLSINASKKERKEQEAELFNEISGQIEINALYRERLLDVRQINAETLQGLTTIITRTQQAREQAQQQFEFLLNFVAESMGRSGQTYDQLLEAYMTGKMGDKEIPIFEDMMKLKKEIEDLGYSLEDLDAKIKEVFSGTSADALADSIANAFKDGEASLYDFGQSFEDIMRNAMYSVLRAKILMPMMETFMEQLAANMQIITSGGVVSGGAIDPSRPGAGGAEMLIQRLKEQWENIGGVAGEWLETMEQISGMDLTGDTAATVQGAIKGVTEETASVLAGQINAMRFNQADILGVTRSSLSELQRIQANTFHLYEIRNLLKGIRINLTENSRTYGG